MNLTLRLLAIVLVCFGMNLAVVEDADARRFGGGRSLGGKSGTIFNRSASRPRTPSQQAAASQNQRARQQVAQRGGLMGMLGGLALGGLLGALFFGGAFENLNFLDFLVFGAIAYMLYRMFAARRAATAPAAGTGSASHAGWSPGGTSFDTAPQPAPAARRDAAASPPGTLPATAGDVDFEEGAPAHDERPADFDEHAFLAGARRAFEMLQQSWHGRDLDEIRDLTTAEMFAAIEEQANEPDADGYVQVLKVDAQLLDVRQIGDIQEAAVLFDAILREAREERPTQVREIWHFTRPAGSLEPKWLLEGIEQLEDVDPPGH